jgi:hypothetical protein
MDFQGQLCFIYGGMAVVEVAYAEGEALQILAQEAAGEEQGADDDRQQYGEKYRLQSPDWCHGASCGFIWRKIILHHHSLDGRYSSLFIIGPLSLYHRPELLMGYAGKMKII